jgi:hypothetical protein
VFGKFYGNDFLMAGFHRAFAALRAIATFRRLDNLWARIVPPFDPPSLPRATAAGFFSLNTG